MKEAYKLIKINDFKLLKDKVYEAIKNGIIQLSLPPKEPLVEQRLAENSGVSKPPIREALLRLEGNTPFHDFIVAQINNEKIIKTYATIRHHLDRYRNIASLIFGRVAKSHREHVLTFKVIEQRDGAQAEKRMAEHLRSVLDDFLISKILQPFWC